MVNCHQSHIALLYSENGCYVLQDGEPAPEARILHSLHRLYSRGNVLREAVPRSVSCIF